ncbi:MAG: hypothetical protein ABI382_08215 [Nakamurella sp.]
MTTPLPQPDPAPEHGPEHGLERPRPPGDDGVSARVGKRTISAGVLPAVVAAALAITGWAWPGWFAGSAGTTFGMIAVALAVLAAAVLLRRSRMWVRAGRDARVWAEQWDVGEISPRAAVDGWVKAVCGAPAPLYLGRGSVPMFRRRRKLAPTILPLRTASGPLAAGHAVVVHARADGAALTQKDQIVVKALGARGPILIGRIDDGAVFAADRWTAGTA